MVAFFLFNEDVVIVALIVVEFRVVMEEKKAVVNRLARAIGHLRKIEKMVANDEDCVAILTQLSAVRSEVTNTGKVILESHLSEGVLAASKSGDPHEIDALNEAIERFVK